MNEETTISLIDTALASGAAGALDPEERRLQELVLAVRDDAPVPAPDFELRMNARVAAGFPSRRRTLHMPALFAKRPRLTALGAIASVAIALVAVAGFENGSSNRQPAQSSRSAAAEKAAPSVQSAGSGSGAASAGSTAGAPNATSGASTSSGSIAVPQPPIQPGGFVGGQNRKVERSASLVLAPDRNQLNQVGDQVIAVTDRYRGIVMQSSITSGSDPGAGGSFDLRIPVGNLQPALRDLSALADVRSRTEQSSDVTASFVNARTRLEELTAQRRGLLRRLANAPTNQAAAAIRAQLRMVDGEIDAQRAELAGLRRQTAYASVSVTLEPQRARSGGGGGGGIGPGARDLRNSLVDAVNLALRVLGVALPIALLVALLWGGGGWLTRRRREAVLDQR